ncbi:MAG: Hsp70 family protein [Bacteriovoracaceae bacterium]|nr:Hsp70 family protein [Bacteriovoracaceae bacterium]
MNSLELIGVEESRIKSISKPFRVLGIDLGTTNSTISEILWNPNTPNNFKCVCLEIDQETTSGVYSNYLVPSVIAIHNNKEVVGEGAKRLFGRMVEFNLTQYENIFLECKNDMGCRRTYHKAPDGYRSPPEISGKILKFLTESVPAEKNFPTKKTVITIPASFQVAQRTDTLEAAKNAGISISGGELIDEPIAAFIDFLLNHPDKIIKSLKLSSKVIVFDFGGGTCDVAIYQVMKNINSKCLDFSPLAVSRYHRLGGGDIDRAIIHDVLLPQLLEQNNLKASDLGFEEKKIFIEPSLTAVAQALKIGISNEISQLEGFDKYEGKEKKELVKIQPGRHICSLKDRDFILQSPSINAEQFEKLLTPFLDQDSLYARETEYNLTCSIFAPIQDAIDRALISADDIDFSLMVGGSSLIPQVQKAVKNYFPSADTLKHTDKESSQLAISKGASYHALALELRGKGLFQIVANDKISIRTESGSVDLIQRGEQLPFPKSNKWREISSLVVPEINRTNLVKVNPNTNTPDFSDPTSITNSSNDIRVELIAGIDDDERLLFEELWRIPNSVKGGEPLLLKYRMDENQVFEFDLSIHSKNDFPSFECSIENPLTNVVNPNQTRIRIQEAEEDLRAGNVPKNEIPDKVVEIARDYSELNQIEKAISFLQRALKMKKEPDSHILNLLGMNFGDLNNWEKEESYYREAARVSTSRAPLFNLALSQKDRGKYKDAKVTINEAISRERDGPSITLKAQIFKSLGEDKPYKENLSEALDCYEDMDNMSDWELGWYLTAAGLSGDDDLKKTIKSEQKKRAAKSKGSLEGRGALPEISLNLDTK